MTDIKLVPDFVAEPKIKVIGVGGAGGNAVNRMISDGLEEVDFITVNTDAAALENNIAPMRIQIGEKLTKGLGAGANPEVGRAAAEESIEQIEEQVKDADMVFIAAGMGGGTGTGAAGLISKIAKEAGALTVAVVTKPFLFEGKVRDRNAKWGISELQKYVDSMIVVENNKLLEIADDSTSLIDSFKMADGVLNNAVGGISNLITKHGLIEVDFADVKAVMSDMGDALMGVGESDAAENRAVLAAEAAINSPLIADINIRGAKGLLVNFTAGLDLGMLEIQKAHQVINDAIGEDAETNVIFGAILDPDMAGKVQVTVIATGFNKANDVVSPLGSGHKETIVKPVSTSKVEQTTMPGVDVPEQKGEAQAAQQEAQPQTQQVVDEPIATQNGEVSSNQQVEITSIESIANNVSEQTPFANVETPSREVPPITNEPIWSNNLDNRTEQNSVNTNIIQKDSDGSYIGQVMGDFDKPAFIRRQMQ